MSTDLSIERRRWAALIVLCTGTLMIVLDLTVVNVALTSIQADLGFTDAGLAWVVNAYMVAFGGLLLLAGRLGDLVGRRRIFLAGLAVFGTSSLACGCAQNSAMLVAARFVQGVGGAMTSAVVLGMIVTMFPQPREQARAIGAFAFVASAGGAVGLLAGGVLTQTLSWHWVFFINVPLAVVTGLSAVRLVENEPGVGRGSSTDVLGAVTVTGALMLGVYAIVGPAATAGWSDPVTLLLGSGALALLAAFVVRESNCADPLVPMGIFRSRNVTGANIIQILAVAGMFGIFFLGSLYLQKVLQYDALQIGLAFLPNCLLMAALSVRYTEPLVSRFGARPVMIVGLGAITAGLVVFAQAPGGGSYVVNVLPVVVLLGVGAGLAFPALMTLAMSDATAENAGLASGIVNTTAQVGAALGLAVLATFSASRSKALAASGADPASAMTGGFHLAFWIAAGLVALAMVAAVFVLAPARATASRADEDLLLIGHEQLRRGPVGVDSPRAVPAAQPEEEFSMNTVVMHDGVSVDGFIADLNDDPGPLHEWYFNGDTPLTRPAADDGEFDHSGTGTSFRVSRASAAYVQSTWDSLGTIVIGRHLFDLVNGWEGHPPVGQHVVVVSHRPKPEDRHPEASYHFVDGVQAAVAKAKELAGDRAVAVNAGDVGAQALAAGLVDEVAMDVVPVVFGSGKRYFGTIDGQHLLEDPHVVIQGDGVLHLRFRVRT